MTFKTYPSQIALRITGLVITIGLGFFLHYQYHLFFSLLILLLLLIAQIYELWHYQMKILRETQKFLEGVRFEDYSTRFELAKAGQPFAQLEQEFIRLLAKLQDRHSEQDYQQAVLNLVLENVGVGLMLVDEKGQVLFSNEKFQTIMGLPAFKEWRRIKEKSPTLAKAVDDFSFQGRKILNLSSEEGSEELYLDISHLSTPKETLHLLSIGTLRNVVEEKEMEAWHRLIRILAHEVMNSVTPVVSLSETLRDMIGTGDKLRKGQNLSQEELMDLSEGLQTISRRSKGMLSFVEEYRKLSQIPVPEKSVISIKSLFEDCISLMRNVAEDQGVTLIHELDQSRLAIEADPKMIEQVLINLIKNALAALSDQKNGRITLRAQLASEGVVIEVEDNGEGIEAELLPQIFIPFFTTRKNGTGIGLSLSKTIMRLHQGDLRVKSVPGEGTVFSLCFCDDPSLN